MVVFPVTVSAEFFYPVVFLDAALGKKTQLSLGDPRSFPSHAVVAQVSGRRGQGAL
jgi:hypothetical protein